MIHHVAHTSAPASAAARRVPAADTDPARTARPQPAADSDAAVVEIDHGKSPVAVGGFGLDLAYTRQVTRHARGQALSDALPPTPLRGGGVASRAEAVSLEFKFATRALPRGEDGEVDVEALANTDEKNALSESIQRLAEEGLRDPGALASFVSAVDDLFAEYERDLGMSEGDLAKARQTFTDEVKSFFARVETDDALPAAPQAAESPFPLDFHSLSEALSGLRERLMTRRQDVLTAAGDLSKVLAELTSEAEGAAPGTEAEARATGRLGAFLGAMKEAIDRRSTRELRAEARQRLLETDAQIVDRAHRRAPSEEAALLGRSFVRHVHAT